MWVIKFKDGTYFQRKRMSTPYLQKARTYTTELAAKRAVSSVGYGTYAGDLSDDKGGHTIKQVILIEV